MKFVGTSKISKSALIEKIGKEIKQRKTKVRVQHIASSQALWIIICKKTLKRKEKYAKNIYIYLCLYQYISSFLMITCTYIKYSE